MSNIIVHPAISSDGLDYLMRSTGMDIQAIGHELCLVPAPPAVPFRSDREVILSVMRWAEQEAARQCAIPAYVSIGQEQD